MKNMRILLPFCLIIIFSICFISCGEQNKSEPNSAENPETSTAIIKEKDKIPDTKPNVDEKKVEKTKVVQAAEENDDFDYEQAVVNITLDDLLKRISERNNKPLLLNLWAAWSAPGVLELPLLAELQKEYGDRIDFILASCDKFSGAIDNVPLVVKSLKIKSEILIITEEDKNKVNSAIDAEWIGSLPFTVIYDANGQKTHRIMGARSKEEFEEILKVVVQSE